MDGGCGRRSLYRGLYFICEDWHVGSFIRRRKIKNFNLKEELEHKNQFKGFPKGGDESHAHRAKTYQNRRC